MKIGACQGKKQNKQQGHDFGELPANLLDQSMRLRVNGDNASPREAPSYLHESDDLILL